MLFYTSIAGLEPTLICYSHIVVNPHYFWEGIRYIEYCNDVIESILIDTGVDKLFNMLNMRDYPSWYISEYVKLVKYMSLRFGNRYEVLYVIPDVPVDYRGRESLYPWNVERTMQYIKLFLERYIDMLKPAKPIAPVQGKRDSVKSVIETYTKYENIYNEFELLALSPVCTSKRYTILAKMVLAFDRTVNKPFHSFGIHIKTIEKLKSWKLRWFRSFDSSAYKYIGNRHYRLAKSRLEIAKSFLEYINKLKKLNVTIGKIVIKTPISF